MGNPAEDPFEAFRKKKQEEEERKKREKEREAAQDEEGSSEGEKSDVKTGEPPKKEFILTRLLRKVSKKGAHRDEPKPEGFDSHRFEGTKHGDEAEGGEKPGGMQSDRFDEEEESE